MRAWGSLWGLFSVVGVGKGSTPSAGPHLEEGPTELSPERREELAFSRQQEGEHPAGHVAGQTLHAGCVPGDSEWAWGRKIGWDWPWQRSEDLGESRG